MKVELGDLEGGQEVGCQGLHHPTLKQVRGAPGRIHGLRELSGRQADRARAETASEATGVALVGQLDKKLLKLHVKRASRRGTIGRRLNAGRTKRD